MEKSVSWVHFLPVALFVYGTRFLGFPSNDGSISIGFFLGSTLALFYLLCSWFRLVSLDYMALGAYLFLFHGSLGYAFTAKQFFPYVLAKQSILFGWILLVGLVTTLVTPEGFIQMSKSGSRLIGSLILLGATAIDFLLSFCLISYAHVDKGIGLILPLLLLVTFRALLRNYFLAWA